MKVILIYDMGIILKLHNMRDVSEIVPLLFMAHVAQVYFHIWSGNILVRGAI